MSLIEQLYDDESIKRIRALYSDDPESKNILFKAFGQKIIEKSDTFLTAKPLDVISLICMTAQFADSEEECHTVAVIIFNRLKDPDPLPMISEHGGLLLSEKTLTSLSFFRPAMEHRWKYHGAPSVKFYRDSSKIIFTKFGHENISEHHEKWENFFEEMFV